jgi:hypothetical protein
MKRMNPKVFPELAHCRSKYTNPRKNHIIIAYFIRNDDQEGSTRVEWSLYQDDEIHVDQPPLVELTSTMEDFHKMLDEGEWEKEGKGEDLVVR